MRRLRDAPRQSLALAGLMSMPLFFVSLMASSLKYEKPTVTHALKHHKVVIVLADPSHSNEAKIWLLAVVPVVVLLLAGSAAMVFGRLGIIATSLCGIAITVALLLPMGRWTVQHTLRFPEGVDLIPHSAGAEDVYLPGEWENAAKTTAHQLGIGTIAIAVIAILFVTLFEVRRRRERPSVPSPPFGLDTGGAGTATGGV